MKDKSNDKTKTWLILAHCFNMDGRAASQTITDRIPLLMKAGIVPVVLSAPTGIKDKRFPHYRVISLAPSGILFEMRQIIKKNFQDLFIQNFLKGFLTIFCLPFYALEKCFIHLDSQWSWFLGASVRGYFLIRKYRPELIYSTAGPPTTHLTGFILNKMCKIPWLAELHDPLIYDNERQKWVNYLFKKWLEKRIFRNASGIIYFSERASENASRRNQIRGKAHVLRPGAAPPDISGVSYTRTKKIHFGHFGSLAEGRNLCVFIQALHEVLQEEPEWRDLVCLDVYGCELDAISKKCLSSCCLDGVLFQHGRLEYDPQTRKSGRQQVLEAMRQCDVLLLVHGDDMISEEYIPSKVYEYLLTYRPIMGLVAPNSELEKILIDSGHIVIDGRNVNDVKKMISEFIERWEREGLPDHKEKASPFTVEDAVAKLLTITRGFK